jgi:hypothetical protein
MFWVGEIIYEACVEWLLSALALTLNLQTSQPNELAWVLTPQTAKLNLKTKEQLRCSAVGRVAVIA